LILPNFDNPFGSDTAKLCLYSNEQFMGHFRSGRRLIAPMLRSSIETGQAVTNCAAS
jgi:hypothetical protein